MVENKSSLFSIIAIIIGASGLGIGAYSVVNFQTVEGPQGLPGEDGIDGDDGQDGIDGKDAPGGIIVGIMDPDEGEIISGNITIRAMITGSESYTISILRNSSEIGTSLPMMWNTEADDDGWWNITIVVADIETTNVSRDEVIVFVRNTPQPRARAFLENSYILGSGGDFYVNFDSETYDIGDNFDLITDTYTVPKDGFYHIIGALMIFNSVGIGNIGVFLVISGQSNPWAITETEGGYYTATIADIRWLSEGTTIRLQGFAPSSWTVQGVNQEEEGTYLTVSYIGE